MALLSRLPQIKNAEEHKQALYHLQRLFQTLQPLSSSCPPAERLITVIKGASRDAGWSFDGLVDQASASPSTDVNHLYNTGADEFGRPRQPAPGSLPLPKSAFSEYHDTIYVAGL